MPGYREITVAGEGRPRRPARTAAPSIAGGWRPALAAALSGAGALCRSSPGTVLGAVLALGAAGAICANALGHQSGPHPAPILPKVAAREAPPAPAPAPRQAARDGIGALIRSEETTASVTPKPDAKAETKPAAKDGRAKPARPAEAAEAPVLRAQRALAKLGYAVKPDGAMGPGTKAAIEKFERDRKLPVTGEAAGRTLRALLERPGQG